MNRVFPLIEPLEGRQLLSAAIGSTVNVGDVGTYIGTAKIRTTADGAVRPTGITLTITTNDPQTHHITGTIAVGKHLTLNINGSVHYHGAALSFGIGSAKVGSGIYSGKIRKHLHVAEGFITLKFAKFSTSAILDLIPSATQTGSGSGSGTGTGSTGGSGTAAVPPPSTLTFPGTTTGGTSTGGTATGGSIFG